MTQVCARVLDIPIDRVYINETATDKVPNASPTAASASTDLYGMAVKVRKIYMYVVTIHVKYNVLLIQTSKTLV